MQSVVAIILIFFLYKNKDINFFEYKNMLCFKVLSNKYDLIFYILSYFTIVGTSNSVNLSDGLDGLSTLLIVTVCIGLFFFSFISSNEVLAHYFNTSFSSKNKDIAIICSSIIGSGLGFLWFNSYPAQIFMGDVGSLSLGGLIGLIAVLLNKEFLLLIIGGIFVIESLSVIIQIIYFKIFKKKILLMAPIHHHFELKGYAENKITIRLWIISIILLIIGINII